MPFLSHRTASSRAAWTAAAVLALAVHAAPAAAAEIAPAGEPFTIAERPEAVGTPGVTWLPHAGSARPAGFFLVWGEGADEDQRSLVGGFVPEEAEAPPRPPFEIAGPARRPDVDVAAGLAGGVAVSFTPSGPPCVGGVLLDPALGIDATLAPAAPGPCSLPFLDSALLPDGRLVVVYERQASQFSIGVDVQLFAPDGTALGEPFEITEIAEHLRFPEVVAVPGGFLVFYVRAAQGRIQVFGPSTLLAQRFGVDGQPVGPPVTAHESAHLIQAPTLVRVSDGWAAAWTEVGMVFNEEGEGALELNTFGRRLAFDGTPLGAVQTLPSDDLRPAPGDRALLVWGESDGGSTVVRARLLGADLAPEGEPVALADRGVAVATSPAGEGLLVWREDDGTLVGQRFAVTAGCVPSETLLCRQDGRFELTVDWAEPQGDVGPGRRVPVESNDSGLLWFFHPDNWELLVKVLDGCPVNGHFWVFSAAATNVEYTLTVNDLVARETRIFRNELGDTARALTATNAFPTCAPPPAP